jgi:hypothetical protein
MNKSNVLRCYICKKEWNNFQIGLFMTGMGLLPYYDLSIKSEYLIYLESKTADLEITSFQVILNEPKNESLIEKYPVLCKKRKHNYKQTSITTFCIKKNNKKFPSASSALDFDLEDLD